MRYLSSVPKRAAMIWEHGGLVFTPAMGNRLDLTGVLWAADNGCYSAGERFNPARRLAWLDSQEPYWPTCQFVVLPDVPFDAAATWERSSQYVDEISQRKLRPARAIQAGIDRAGVPWNEIGAVFIAGRDHRFKQSQTCRRIVLAARGRGMPAHYARANSGKTVQVAFDMSCTSADGTFLKYHRTSISSACKAGSRGRCRRPRQDARTRNRHAATPYVIGWRPIPTMRPVMRDLGDNEHMADRQQARLSILPYREPCPLLSSLERLEARRLSG